MKSTVYKPFMIVLAALILAIFPQIAHADPATVTNNGNTRVRVQYFQTPENEYRNVYLDPGETKTLPGGVEKVKLVREIGEWASPLPPGVTLDVEVKVGDRTVGHSTWYGDKVFFDGPTDAPPKFMTPVAIPPTVIETTPAGASTTTPEPVRTEPERKPEPEVKQETETHSPFWPWYGYLAEWHLMLILLLLLIPFVLAFGRSLRTPGWRMDGYTAGCLSMYIFVGIIFGFAFGAWGYWGFHAYGSERGILPFFAQDLYAFPIYFVVNVCKLTGVHASDVLRTVPNIAVIIPFWIIICALLGGVVGTVRAPLLYGLGLILALVPISIILLGLWGPGAYAWQSKYSDYVPIREGAFASLLVIPLLFIVLLNFVRPYHGYVNGRSDYAYRPFSGIGCTTLFLLVLLAIILVLVGDWGYSAYGKDFFWHPLFSAIVCWPFMAECPYLGYPWFAYLFWGLMFGGLGLGLSRCRYRNCFLGCSTATLIALMIIVTSMQMGRDVFEAVDRDIYEQYEDMMYGLPAYSDDLPDAVLEAYGELRRAGVGGGQSHLMEDDRDDFGDTIGGIRARLRGIGRDLIENDSQYQR